MMHPRISLLTLMLWLALLPGCATRREMPVDEALFPRAPVAPDSRAVGRVAVLVQPTVRDMVHEGEEGPAAGMRIPIGRIVTEAMLASAGDIFAGGAQRIEASSAADARYVATLTVQSVRVMYHFHILWFIPIPPFNGVGDAEYDEQLAFDITVHDPQGRVVWTRTYDDGRQIWQHSWTNKAKASEGLLRITHEAAWRLSQKVMDDLREWVEGERMRPRSL
jgi:hypothetical protein